MDIYNTSPYYKKMVKLENGARRGSLDLEDIRLHLQLHENPITERMELIRQPQTSDLPMTVQQLLYTLLQVQIEILDELKNGKRE